MFHSKRSYIPTKGMEGMLNMFFFLTLSDVGRDGQKGKKSECFQKFSSRRVHFPHGLMDKVLDFYTKGP